VVGGAPIASLRANLHELAAEFHELAAAIHDWKAEEHAQAVLHSLGDVSFHELWRDLRRTAATAERASAQKQRQAAEYWRGRSDGDVSDEGRVDVAGL
jgi:ribosomal protein L12E/L44/L45/RPP1/RPP2